MYIRTFPLPPEGANSHLVWTDAGEAVVVDCGGEPGAVLAELAARSLRLVAVLVTHLHPDHIRGVPALVAGTRATVFAPAADALLLPGGRVAFAFQDALPGRLTLLGEPCLVLPVPGHTPGHVAYYFPKSWTAFTGDCLFRGSVGRTDGPGGDAGRLLASIRERLLSLPEAVELFPGHGPSTTVGREKVENPFFADWPHTP
jgi:glyoxylase-like metal-dependent hydrolase (beta-lactamase superfamily II)